MAELDGAERDTGEGGQALSFIKENQEKFTEFVLIEFVTRKFLETSVAQQCSEAIAWSEIQRGEARDQRGAKEEQRI